MKATRAIPVFSTRWKHFFHPMEKCGKWFPSHGKILCSSVLAAGLIAAATGCESIKGSRLAVVKRVHWRATASASEEGHGPELALDGQTNTWWRSGTEEPQWMEVDLARVSMVCAFSLQWAAPHATAYSIQTSRDGEHWAVGLEITDSDGDWDQISIEPILARYVRLVIEKGFQGGGAALSMLDVQGLSGRPQVWVDGVLVPDAAALLDGDQGTVWHCGASEAELELDLRSVKPIGSIRVDWGTNGVASTVDVAVSTNREHWVKAGRIRASSGDFDVLMTEKVHEAQFVRLSFAEDGTSNGFSVAGITLRGAEGTSRPWAMYELAASHAPEGIYPDAFHRRQTYWAIAGGPLRSDPESLLDEAGTFSPRAQSPSLSPLVFSGGEVFSARQATEVEFRLGADGAPLPETVWRLPSGLSLTIRALAKSGSSPASSWVQYELKNDSIMSQTGRLCWVVRPVRVPPPWAGGGLAPIHRMRIRTLKDSWQEMLADGIPLFAVPNDSLQAGVTAFKDGDATEALLRGSVPDSHFARDPEGLVSGAWAMPFDLEPGDRVRMVIGANAEPPSHKPLTRFPWPEGMGDLEEVANEFDREWVDASWLWRAETERYAPKIARPDAIDCLHAQVGWMMSLHTLVGAEGDALQSIQMRAAALLRAGQASVAKTWVDQVSMAVETNGWVPSRFLSDGSPASPLGQEGRHASQGQFAFMVMDYYRFTHDLAFLQEHYPKLKQALVYLEHLRQDVEETEWKLSDEDRFLLEGLLPLSGAQPGRPQPVHCYTDQVWALLAWKEGRAAASILGLEAEAKWADEQYRALRSAVRRSLRVRMDDMEDPWIPASAETPEFDPRLVALLFWPAEESDLVEPHELQRSLDTFYDEFLKRQQPGWAGEIPSDEALLLTPLARMGRGDYAREVLYAQLERRQPPGWQLWADVMTLDSRQPGQIGPMPDLKAAAAYFIAVRGLAAREEGQRLDLFSGAPAEWIQHGEGYRVYGMPTAFGPLDMACYWQRDRMWIEVGGSADPPEGYRIWWPRQIAPERVMANGESIKTFDAQGLDLPHDFNGSIEVFFPFLAPWPRDP
jgi:F5/8 type C domain